MDLNHHFLIAMPGLTDPYFHKTVTYICKYHEQGCLGITINRPLTLRLGDLFDHLNIPLKDQSLSGRKIYAGGPVETGQGFVLHSSDSSWQYSMKINDQVTLSSSHDVLEAIGAGEGPKEFLISLGYSGWSDGQLEKEMLENSWITCPADKHILFHLESEKRWQAAAKKLGFDINLMSMDSGHA